MGDLKFNITVLVDEETLRDAADAEPEESTTGVLEREFGWLNASGVAVTNIEEIPNIVKTEMVPGPKVIRSDELSTELDNDGFQIGEGFGGM